MGPAELAALLAREADAGVAGALSAFDASGVLEVEQVVGRIGSRPSDDTNEWEAAWEDVIWQAEVVMRPSGTVRAVGSAPAAPPDVPGIVSALRVSALRGVGAEWSQLLQGRGVETVGALASLPPGTVASWSRLEAGAYAVQLVARARTCALTWPAVDPSDRRSILEVTRADPTDVTGWPPGSRADALSLWGACLQLRSAIDDDVLARIAVNAG